MVECACPVAHKSHFVRPQPPPPPPSPLLLFSTYSSECQSESVIAASNSTIKFENLVRSLQKIHIRLDGKALQSKITERYRIYIYFFFGRMIVRIWMWIFMLFDDLTLVTLCCRACCSCRFKSAHRIGRRTKINTLLIRNC